MFASNILLHYLIIKMSSNLKNTLLFALLAIAAAGLLKWDWHMATAGMIVFLIAYLSKGMRRHVSSNPLPRQLLYKR